MNQPEAAAMSGPDVAGAVEYNKRLRYAREHTPSRRTPGVCLGRQELAELANEWIYHHRRRITALDNNYIGKLERGQIRWPGKDCRAALRDVLGAVNDAALGFYDTRRMPPQTTPAERERYLRLTAGAGAATAPPPTPGKSRNALGGIGAAAGHGQPLPAGCCCVPASVADHRGGGGFAPVCTVPEHAGRLVLHWTGGKAWELRNAMRLSVPEFAAKLGVPPTVVRDWHNEAAGRLTFETHQLLDTMLSLAADEDVRRFDLALYEMGERR